MLLMAIGDSHGNSRFVHACIERADRLRDRVERDIFMVSVGDFGFWPGRDGKAFLDGVDKSARAHDLAYWAIDGHHDYPGDSRSTRSGYRAWTDPDPSPDRPGLVHVPRGTVVEVSGVTIGLCGVRRHPTWSAASQVLAGGPTRGSPTERSHSSKKPDDASTS